MSTNHLHLTQRGTSLLYVGIPLDKPIITLENYGKWYEIYLLNPDGTVTPVDVKIVSEVMDKYFDALWIDHRYSQRLLYRLAQHTGYFLDERALEVALGRWIMENGSAVSEYYQAPDDGPEVVEV